LFEKSCTTVPLLCGRDGTGLRAHLVERRETCVSRGQTHVFPELTVNFADPLLTSAAGSAAGSAATAAG